MRATVLKIAGMLGAVILLAFQAQADDGRSDHDGDTRKDRHERIAERRKDGELLPLAEILKALHAKFPGKVLEIEFEDDGNPIYEFYVLQPSGRVVEVEYDARTGAFLGQENKD